MRYLRFSAAKMHLQAKKRLGSAFRRFPVFDSALVPNLSNKRGTPVLRMTHRVHPAAQRDKTGYETIQLFTSIS